MHGVSASTEYVIFFLSHLLVCFFPFVVLPYICNISKPPQHVHCVPGITLTVLATS